MFQTNQKKMGNMSNKAEETALECPKGAVEACHVGGLGGATEDTE